MRRRDKSDMANTETIKVGVFGASSPEAKVPSNMEGMTIYYSKKYRFFMITDVNGNTIGDFDFNKFDELNQIDVILYTTEGTKNHMMGLLREWKAQHAPVEEFAEEDFVEEETSVRHSRRSHAKSDEELLGSDAASLQKDPTRHLGVFMTLMFIFTIILIIAINFGKPIIQAVAPLLS